MSAELGTFDDPRALVPGDAAAIAADARALADRSGELARTGDALRRIGTGAWTGRAADAWREHHDEDAVRWFQAADSLDAASRALACHADALARAQAEAARAVALWRFAEAATDDIERQVAAGAAPPPVDPGDEPRRGAVEILAAARTELARSGDQVASVLRGEAMLAPRDSQKQTDADFYGGIWDSVSGAAEGAWTLVTDPADAVAGAVQAAAHPVDTAQNAVAYDDWSNGREPRALGRNTGDLLLGAATLGVGKIASTLGRETRIAGERVEPAPAETPARDPAIGGTSPAASTPEARADAVRSIVLGSDGKPHGREDSRGVYLVDKSTLNDVRSQLTRSLGEPSRLMNTGKGQIEVWMMGGESRANVTYRTYSSSGGATIDVNRIDGTYVARYHIDDGGGG